MKCSLCKKMKHRFYLPVSITLKKPICLDCKKEISSKTIGRQLQRIIVLNAYGNGACQCCGEKELEFLTLDHMDKIKNYSKHRGWSEYRFLLMNKFPHKDKLRVLCMNCNWSIGIKGYCPHKEKSKDRVLQSLVL